jgi:hypothetical protein
MATFAWKAWRSMQCLALSLRATGFLLLEDLLGSSRFELGDLRFQILARRLTHPH